MSFASTITWLSLDRYAAVMGINPMHFNQCYHPTLSPDSSCSSIFYQYAWQRGDAVSREDLARAISDAENRISTYLGYPLLPDWAVDEDHRNTRPLRPELVNATGYNTRSFYKSIETRWAYVRSGGIKERTLNTAVAIDNIGNPTYGYSDLDNDGFAESVVMTIDTPSYDDCELRVYVPDEIGAFTEDHEIKPVKISSSGGTTTITFYKWQTLDPRLTIQLAAQAWDITQTTTPGGDDIFAQTLAVYRVRNDPQQQVQFLWEQPQCGNCGGSGCTACVFATQYGCLAVRDSRMGFVTYKPATWDADTSTFDDADYVECRDPDRMKLWYYAGWRDESRACPNRQLDPALERAIAYYATALLDRNVCDCSNVSYFADYWREDLSRVDTSRSFQAAPRVLENPFGQTRGALYAWNVVNEERRRVVRNGSS